MMKKITSIQFLDFLRFLEFFSTTASCSASNFTSTYISWVFFFDKILIFKIFFPFSTFLARILDTNDAWATSKKFFFGLKIFLRYNKTIICSRKKLGATKNKIHHFFWNTLLYMQPIYLYFLLKFYTRICYNKKNVLSPSLSP